MQHRQEQDIPSAPMSASNFGVNLIAMVIGVGCLLELQLHRPESTFWNVIFACVIIVSIIGVYDLFFERVWHRDSAGLVALKLRVTSLSRVGVKLIGLCASLALPACAYWLFPEYHGSFYDPWWRVMKTVGLAMLLAAPFYFYWVDGVQRDPYDGYWHLGAVLLRREKPNVQRILQHYGGWVVKGFFLPLMFVYMIQQTDGLTAEFHRMVQGDQMSFYRFAYGLIFTVDVIFAVIGYSMSMRIFDSHIRSTEPTGLGWMVALIGYQPFWSVIGHQYLAYDRHTLNWGPWLEGLPLLQVLWGGTIIVLVSIYSLSTISFGLRFSNLTHRGILTSGPYRYSKHPAYISKNISWWLISVPFISTAGISEAIRGCALLLLVNGIYYLRAVTEDRHLSRDPHYLQYKAWIAEHGLFARIKRKTTRILGGCASR